MCRTSGWKHNIGSVPVSMQHGRSEVRERQQEMKEKEEAIERKGRAEK